MSTDRDLELGAALRALPAPEHGPDFWESLEEQLGDEPAPSELERRRGSGRRFAPRGMWLLSAAAVVAMVVTAVTLIGNDEGTRIRVTPATPEEATWTTLPDSPLSGRHGHVAVWTGERMLVWGGQGADRNGEPVGDGASYDPATERWAPMAASPTGPLFGATGVWTGTRMLVWGTPFNGPGDAAQPTAEAGASYDPATDRWTPISPSPLRTVGGHTAVWTGERMVVWGGSVGESPVADGAAYDPATDRWTELSPAPLSARFDHTAVWAGDRILVWGGFAGEESPSGITAFADGAAYDPATDSWATLPAAPIAPRGMHAAEWTGGRMVVWGGSGDTGLMADGARYDPATAGWQVLPASPLRGRLLPSAVAAQGSMLVWGGDDLQGASDDGAAYDPAMDAWTALPDSPIGARSRHGAVWTGSAMLVWGGFEGQTFLADGAAFRFVARRTTDRSTTTPPTTAGGPITTTTAGPVAPPPTLAPGTDPGTPPVTPPTGGLATPNDAVRCVFRAFLANAPAQALPCSRSQADVDELFANFQPNGVTREQLATWRLSECSTTQTPGLNRCTFKPPGPVAGPVTQFRWLTEQRGAQHFFAGFEYDGPEPPD